MLEIRHSFPYILLSQFLLTMNIFFYFFSENLLVSCSVKMAQEQAEAKNLFILNYFEQMEKLDQCLTWFSLRDNVMSKILIKYFQRENIDNNFRLLLERFNICKRILSNPE